MMKKINVAELLKDCPKGMDLDCTMFDDVTFYCVEDNNKILINTPCGIIHLSKNGCYHSNDYAKCVIFPKGKTSWEGFVPPCKFKDGDIIFTYTNNYTWVSIFKHFSGNSCYTYVDLCMAKNDLFTNTSCLCTIKKINIQRLATEEEKEKLFKSIEENGYKWNKETKTLEKLPKFKVGDRIKHIVGREEFATVVSVEKLHYNLDSNVGTSSFSISLQHEWELVPKKFNITTLKPFESKVLVRNDKYQYWIPAFWGCKRADGYITTFGWCKYCIPYEGNEHLLETNKDCDEHFKTWK